MIEVGANEVSEEILMKALERAREELDKIQKWQAGIIAEIGKPKQEYKKTEIPETLKAVFDEKILPKLPETMGEAGKDKIYALEEEWFNILETEMPDFDHYEGGWCRAIQTYLLFPLV